MINVYEECRPFENDFFLVRLLKEDDLEELFQVYSDVKALPFFNADNCDDDFYYHTIDMMKKAINFWLFSYENGYFVRYSIIAKEVNRIIGTFEIFYKESKDSFGDSCFLRLDLASEFENYETIKPLLVFSLPHLQEALNTKKVITKMFCNSFGRSKALIEMGFTRIKESLIGKNNVSFGDYYVLD